MSFPRYPAYKDSGVEWLGEVPAHWEVSPIKRLIRKVESGTSVNASDEPAEDGKYGVLKTSCVYTGTFDPDENKTVLAEDIHRVSCPVKAGTLIVSRMNTPDLIGAAGFVAQDRNNLFLPDRLWQISFSTADARFIHFWTLTSLYRGQVKAVCTGTSPSMKNLGQDQFGSFSFASPPLSEQTQIAAFLDRETAKIDALVAEQRRLMELLKDELNSLVLSASTLESTRHIRLAHAAEVVSRPVSQREGELYIPLGLFNRGRGLFHKDPREMAEMGDSDFFWIEDGDLIISGQFAWEGAVALAGPEESGCVVSHRYPVLRGQNGVALTEYLYALLCTKHGDFLLNESSWGAAGRNRPLNINLLLKEKIPIPAMETQMKVARAVRNRKRLVEEIAKQADLLQERRTALISAAVTGQIDVRGAVHSL